MFLFNFCCGTSNPRGYQVIKRDGHEETISFITNLNDIKQSDRLNSQTTIHKIQKSDYDQLIKSYKGTQKKWEDESFPPTQKSQGNIPDLKTSHWKRISDILNKPALFDGDVQPKDVIQGSLGDCYFLSALAALAEEPGRIKKAFGNQSYNINGIYKVVLRIDGIVQEIVVDDYIPVNSAGEPLFCQPNKDEFWVLIMEKAWAKAHGSYANIIAGNPVEVLKAVTYAPSELALVKNTQEQRQKLWRVIQTRAMKNYPCCCGTSDNQNIDWQRIGLVRCHAYTLIHASILRDKDGNQHRMMILRNPWGHLEWQGQGNQFDTKFWSNIERSMQRLSFEKYQKLGNDGIFFMTYVDFCQYFAQVDFCMAEKTGNYISQQLLLDGKHGLMFNIKINKPGQYTFELHQDGLRGQNEFKMEEGLCRSTLLLACYDERLKEYQYVNAIMKYNDEDTTLITELQPGNYVLYCKIDPTCTRKLMPNKSSVSVYSKQFVNLVASQQKNHPGFLRNVFMNYAHNNTRESHNNGKMWLSWKLLFQRGGYAFIAFQNSVESDRKFVVSLDQEQMLSKNFKLKKPYKNRGKQTIEVMPGQSSIILFRISNVVIRSIKFPPPLDIKMEKLDN